MLSTRLYARLAYAAIDLELLNAAKDKEDKIDSIAKALAAGAQINIKDVRVEGEFNYIGFYYSSLMWAVHRGHVKKVEFLLEKGADPETKTARGNTILHVAAREGHWDLYKLLADKFPKLRYMKGEDNLTPEDIAKKYNQETVLVGAKTFYSNDFLPSAKVVIPGEIASNIANHSDLASLIFLKRTSQKWNSLFNQDPEKYKLSIVSKIKAALPANLRGKTWDEVFKAIYPNETYEGDALTALLKRMHTCYVVGGGIKVLEKNNPGIIEQLSHVVDIWHRQSFYKACKVSDEQVQASFQYIYSAATEVYVAELKKSVPFVSIFRHYDEAADMEYEPFKKFLTANGQFSNAKLLDEVYRSPIFEIVITTEAALKLLACSHSAMRVPSSDLVVRATRWQMSTDHLYAASSLSAEFAKPHEVQDGKQFVRSFTR